MTTVGDKRLQGQLRKPQAEHETVLVPRCLSKYNSTINVFSNNAGHKLNAVLVNTAQYVKAACYPLSSLHLTAVQWCP